MPNAPVLPRGAGSRRKTFEDLVKGMATKYKKAYKKVYAREIKILVADIIDHSPIDTGLSAGVTSNSTGEQKRPPYKTHPAFSLKPGNELGDSGWQVRQAGETNSAFKMSILNPMWNDYLKYYELGLLTAITAEDHFVFNAWKRHQQRMQDRVKLVKNEL